MLTEEGCIFFIYDTQKGKNLREEDDLVTAISYFLPATWNPDKKCWLCGALMAATNQASKMMGQPPEVIKLGKTKFASICTGRYALVFGVHLDAFSDHFLVNVVQYILRIVNLFYPSIDYLLGSVESEQVLTAVVRTIMSKPYIETEFNTAPFVVHSKIPRRVLLKCLHVVDFVTSQSTVLGCSLHFNGRIVKSNLKPDLSTVVQFCTTCDVLSKKMGILRQGCNYCPIFMPQREYAMMITKQKRMNDFSFNASGDYIGTISQSCKGNNRDGHAEIARRFSKDARSNHSSPRQAGMVLSSSDDESARPSARHRKPRADETYGDTVELALYFMTVSDCSIAVIMDAGSQEGVNTSKYILQTCAKDMTDINERLGESRCVTDTVASGKSIDFSRSSRKLQSSSMSCKDARQWLLSARDELDCNSNVLQLTFRKSRCMLKYEANFGREKIDFETR